MRGSDVGYDERNDVYLLVVGNGPIFGIFVNSAGNPVTGGFPIMSGQGWGHFPRAKYSPDAGGFLVTWHADGGGANFVFGRMVHFPGGPSSGIAQISDGQQGGSWWESGPPIAYLTVEWPVPRGLA